MLPLFLYVNLMNSCMELHCLLIWYFSWKWCNLIIYVDKTYVSNMCIYVHMHIHMYVSFWFMSFNFCARVEYLCKFGTIPKLTNFQYIYIYTLPCSSYWILLWMSEKSVSVKPSKFSFSKSLQYVSEVEALVKN